MVRRRLVIAEPRGTVDGSFFGIFFLVVAVLVRPHPLCARRCLPPRMGHRSFSGAASPLHSSAALGGVAIFISLSAEHGRVAALLGAYLPNLHSALPEDHTHHFWFRLRSFSFSEVYDDLYSVGPYIKFAVQSLAATMLFMAACAFLISRYCSANISSRGLWACPFTILWVSPSPTPSTYHGLDGLAAGSALFSTLVAFVVALRCYILTVSLCAVVRIM